MGTLKLFDGNDWQKIVGSGGDKPWKFKELVTEADVTRLDLDFDGDNPSEIKLSTYMRFSNADNTELSGSCNVGFQLLYANSKTIDIGYKGIYYKRATNYPYQVKAEITKGVLYFYICRTESQSWTSNSTVYTRVVDAEFDRTQYPTSRPDDATKPTGIRLQSYDSGVLLKAGSRLTLEWR